MLRIDENTYIDDKLVTCAEYQLFIDEMREQGKYYQPDRWKSHHFPSGLAREPVLGVSVIDAQAFCEWLTLRTDGNWRYRLPTPQEATDYPLTILFSSPRSYWTLSAEGILSKVWIGEDYIETHAIDRRSVNRPRDLDLEILDLRSKFIDRVRNSNPEFVPAANEAIDHAKAIVRNVVFSHIKENLLKDAEEINQFLINNTDYVNLLSYSRSRDKILAQARELEIIDDARLETDNMLAEISKINTTWINEINNLIDMIWWREILATSPAFEGIRLIKENVKMTWQCIDEGTYINDALVTCAEYQLFVDELREQGVYRQPDHWNSYQFPKGHAREPILGVRYSDAIAYCEWLTKREAGEWRYRIPNTIEATKYIWEPNRGRLFLGYWTLSAGNHLRFTWIGSTPDDPRMISLDRVLEHSHELNLDLNHNLTHALTRAHQLAHVLDLDLTLDLILDFEDLEHTYTLAHILGRGRALDLDYDHTFNLALNLAFNRALSINDGFVMYIDIFTLQERIAGRSPAFEGIRLVKERIR